VYTLLHSSSHAAQFHRWLIVLGIIAFIGLLAGLRARHKQGARLAGEKEYRERMRLAHGWQQSAVYVPIQRQQGR
jgi:hypothetical protein